MGSMTRKQRTIRLVAGIGCLLVLGCGGQPAVEMHPVSGSVTVNGRPAEGVYLQFHAVDSQRIGAPDGTKTEADGSYRVPVHESGEYLVTAFWPAVTVVDGEEIEGDDRLAGYYHDLGRPAGKVTIREGENALPPINLQTH